MAIWYFFSLAVGTNQGNLCGFIFEYHLKFVIWIDKLLFNLQHELSSVFMAK